MFLRTYLRPSQITVGGSSVRMHFPQHNAKAPNVTGNGEVSVADALGRIPDQIPTRRYCSKNRPRRICFKQWRKPRYWSTRTWEIISGSPAIRRLFCGRAEVLFHYTHSRPRSQYEFLSAWATSTSPEFRIILVFWTNMIPRARTMDKTLGGGGELLAWVNMFVPFV